MRAFEIPNGEKTVHQLRRTLEGVQHLKETGRYKEYMAQYERSATPFMAWDGEGWSDAAADHSYMLFMNSSGANISAPRLSTWEIFDFILSQAAQFEKHIHVMYGFGYDVTHWLRDVDIEKRKELLDNTIVRIRTPDGVRRNQYTVEYIPHKWFTITGWDYETRKRVRIKFYDIMTFFQSSAIKAWESRDIPLPDEIRSGKASRNTFTYDDLEEISLYCQMELDATVLLANRLRDEFKQAGLNVSQWHGPGAVATAVFKKYKIKDHKTEPSEKIERALQHAYFGGRFEQFKAGHYDGRVYVYDINSAYPDKIRNLPSLSGAKWRHTLVYRGMPGLYRVRYEDWGDFDGRAHPVPWRGKGGRVGFPRVNNDVWVWHFEAEYATEVIEGYELHTATDEKPFAFVSKMYDQRKRWKREGKGGERALKLAMNSIYGKTAQTIGGDPENGIRPPWHQLEWAGMITSATRAQLWQAMSQAPGQIIAVETDSVASMVPLDLDIGDGLGQWELTEYDNMTYIQSGVYFADSVAHGDKVRSRGIDVKQLKYSEVMEHLKHPDGDPILVTAREFIGITNPRTQLYGQWNDTTKQVRVAGGKRVHLPEYCPECSTGQGMDEIMHTLVSAPGMGLRASEPHRLPWIDGEPLEGSETAQTTTEAVAAYDSARHVA